MNDQNIVHQSSGTAALNAEHYQTFEMAKANDGILGGNDIAQIRSYAAYARAQAQAIHKTIAATSTLDDVASIKAEATETAQTFAKVGIYADQRIGEILRELPTRQGKRTDLTSSDATDKVTRQQAINDAGIERSQAYDLQKMAANPEVVEAVIAKATKEGRVVSRRQVLDAIKERDDARRELRKAAITQTNLEQTVESLKQQVDAKPFPQVITKEVVREVVPEDVQRRMESIQSDNERLNREYQEMWAKKRELDKKLEQANALLGEKERSDNAKWDIEALTAATNNYLRQYGGKAWAFDQFYRVDKLTQQEFERAITNLAAFASNLAQMIQDKEMIGASNE